LPRLPIHVDAAYGGFVLPFTEPDFEWDFRVSEVMSINISNHKFGLVYPGLGTAVFRDPGVVPASLKTKVDYLGREITDYALNFSRASSQVICQYYNFLRFGEVGYRKIMKTILQNASLLANGLLELECTLEEGAEPCFELLTSHRRSKNGWIHVRLPNIVVKLNEKVPFTADELTTLLKVDGWSVPSYHLPKHLENVNVLRMVVKENFSADMVEFFLISMKNAIEKLTSENGAHSGAEKTNGLHVIC
jgi:glutamate decarboxylase